ncbi:MAG: prefoldin subunit beta [Thermoproteota archaeon]|jgi:prefoldin beta subunit|nr:prefoldin subunit beta [Thermoproteota archaeon]
MSEEDLPPWIKEQVSRLHQIQQNLQAIMMKKQQIEQETSETDRVIEEIKKIDEDKVYKRHNTLLVKAKREDILKELKEKKYALNIRMEVIEKQEKRVSDNLKEVENKIIKMRTLLDND